MMVICMISHNFKAAKNDKEMAFNKFIFQNLSLKVKPNSKCRINFKA